MGKENALKAIENVNILRKDKKNDENKKKIVQKTFWSSPPLDTEAGEYAHEIGVTLMYSEALAKNRIRSTYMDNKQFHLTWDMRSILVDWLVSVQTENKLSNKTLHLAVHLIDKCLRYMKVTRERFQLIGASAMLIAGKVEDIYPPVGNEWSYLTGGAFTRRQIMRMEAKMLKLVQFHVHPPTVLDFIEHMCVVYKIDEKIKNLAMYLSELCLLEGRDYLDYYPSQLAAASVLLAQFTISESEAVPQVNETHVYSLKQLSPIIKKQHHTLKSSPFKDQQSIQTKYSSSEYGAVSLLKPKALVLDDDDDDYHWDNNENQ